MNQATTLARHLVRRLIESGVSDVVIAPGSRNAPLSLAFAEARDRGLIEVHVRIDERSAAYFALGIAKATNKYVPVVVTSGTAVANLFPAVLEAYQSGDRLLLLTADRPERLRKTGANQTTLQQGIFANFVTKAIDSAVPFELNSSLQHRGPVHFNLQFDEPLLPEGDVDPFDHLQVSPLSERVLVPADISINQKRVVVVIGHDRAGLSVESINDFVESVGAIAISEDPISFPLAIPHASIILSSKRVREELAPELVIVIGRTTLHRSFNTYISLAKKIMVIDARTLDIDTRRSADEIHHCLPRVMASEARAHTKSWRLIWDQFAESARQAISTSAEWSEGRVAAAVAQISCDALFVASSRPIRDVEAFAISEEDLGNQSEARRPQVFANRGLAGIDGNISTAMGIATRFEKTIALIGDLAFLHDISALANTRTENLTFIVVDNDGGGIFSTLPQRGVPHFEEVFGTPHGKSIKKLATAFGIKAVEVASVAELLDAAKEKGLKVIVAKMPPRDENADNLKSIFDRFEMLTQI